VVAEIPSHRQPEMRRRGGAMRRWRRIAGMVERLRGSRFAQELKTSSRFSPRLEVQWGRKKVGR